MTTTEAVTPEALALKARQVEEARLRYEAARKAEAEANRDVTRALNSLNAAQKSFDDALAAFRTASPRDSDWHTRNHSFNPAVRS